MYYKQDVSGYFQETVGKSGLAADALGPYKAPLRKSLARLKQQHDDGTLPLLTLPYLRKDLQLLEPVARRFQDDFTDVVVLGTGGSSLGGKTLAVLAEEQGITLHFMDNIDPKTFKKLFQRLKGPSTGFIVISKSGGTAETLLQFLTALTHWQALEGTAALRNHFVVITEKKASPIRALAKKYEISCLDHDPELGGRFSVLSLVALLPAMILGIDPVRIRTGAAKVLEHTLSAKTLEENAPAIGAFTAVALGQKYQNAVLMPYIDDLEVFTKWHRQLWAESLGKSGKGTTPIDALGAVDQHSQLQLYLDGPRDKFFTIIVKNNCEDELPPTIDVPDNKDLKLLRTASLGDLLRAEHLATTTTLIKNGCPTRLIEVDEINAETLGALLMHFMLETIIAADLLKVNPFDQPAVEEGKKLAKDYLVSLKK